MFSRKTAQRTCRSPPSAPLLFVQLCLRTAGWQTKGDPPAQTAPRRILMICQTAALFPRVGPRISAAPRALRFPRSASGRPSPQTPCTPPQSAHRSQREPPLPPSSFYFSCLSYLIRSFYAMPFFMKDTAQCCARSRACPRPPIPRAHPQSLRTQSILSRP